MVWVSHHLMRKIHVILRASYEYDILPVLLLHPVLLDYEAH